MVIRSKNVIKLKTVEIYCGLSETKSKHIFTAIKNDEKIVVFFDENIGEEYESNSLFCNYLKNEEELDLFFDSIEIEKYIITNDMCNGHYRYCENPKGESINVRFIVSEIINGVDIEACFCDGMWFSGMDDEELLGDISEMIRENYIKTVQDKLSEI